MSRRNKMLDSYRARQAAEARAARARTAAAKQTEGAMASEPAATPQRQRDKHSEVTSTSQDVANAGTTTGEASMREAPYSRLLRKLRQDQGGAQ